MANWATINHLKALKHETVEDILGNTLRIDEQQSNSNFNDDGSETNTLHDRSLYQFQKNVPSIFGQKDKFLNSDTFNSGKH